MRTASMRTLAMMGLLAQPVLGAAVQSSTNPIRKVVTMLQAMQTKVTEEGKKEEALYDKFMCYCSKNGGDLTASIESAEAKLDSVSSDLKAAQERKVQTEAELKGNQESKTDAQETVAKAKEIRAKEAAAFAKEKSELETNIAAIHKAVAALEKGMAGSFLQTTEAARIRDLVIDSSTLPDTTREEVMSFLSGGQRDGYAPQSGEVTGILKTLSDEMTKDLSDAEAAEAEAIKNFEELIAAKEKELAALQLKIEEQMQRIGDLGMQIAEQGNDIEDTQEALQADQGFKKELEASCATKTGDWEAIKKTRAEELVALSETIELLNSDDSLELFKKTLAEPASLLQLASSAAAQRAAALAEIASVRRGASAGARPALDFLALALRGKKMGFEKVITMIDEMAANLKAEQVQDEAKKEYCDKQIDVTEDKLKQLEHSLADTEKVIDELHGAIETTTEEIAALTAGIKALDKSVADATEQRKAENEEFKALIADDSAAKEVLGFAKNRLNQFYNPKLYKAPAKKELAEESAVASLVQIRAHGRSEDAPPPPPETFGPYTKKGQETNGVLAMIDMLVKDLDKEMQEATVNEKDSQGDYEKMMADAAQKRAADSKSLTERESAKADAETGLQAAKDSKTDTTQELMAASKYLSEIHAECDWLLKYFEARKEARTSEIDSLKNAKAVLSGADYSLVQVQRRHSAFLSK